MKRRGVIRAFVLSPAMLTLTSCAERWSVDKVSGSPTGFSSSELEILSTVADTIIPSDGSIGALSTDTHLFLARLVSDCFDSDFQSEFKAHLADLNANAIKEFSSNLSDLDQSQREKQLISYEQAGGDETAFFSFLKSQAIRGFQTSELVMVNHLGYVMAPGFYNGNVDL